MRGGLVFANSRAVKVYPEKTISDDEIKASAKACGKKSEKYCDVNYKSPWYAFNIASIGVDAYVVYLTNTVKKKLPGNFYHFCVPLSGIIYDKTKGTKYQGQAFPEFMQKIIKAEGLINYINNK